MGSRGKRSLCVTAIAAAAMLISASSASAAGTLDQQQTISNFGGMQVDSAFSKAQTFTAGITGQLDQVDLALSGAAPPNSPLTVEIRDVAALIPGTTVLATASVPAGAAPGSETLVQIPFTSPAPVTAGTQYAIVAHSATTTITNSWFWYAGQSGAPGSAYPGGAFLGLAGGPPATGLWTGGSPADLVFKTYVTPPPPPATGGGGSTTPTPTSPVQKKKCKKKKAKGKRAAVSKKKKCKKRKR